MRGIYISAWHAHRQGGNNLSNGRRDPGRVSVHGKTGTFWLCGSTTAARAHGEGNSGKTGAGKNKGAWVPLFRQHSEWRGLYCHKTGDRKKLEVHSCIGRPFLGLSTSVLSVRSKVCEMVFGKSRKTHLRLQKKHGCANMDKALDRYIIHAVWKRKKMTVS